MRRAVPAVLALLVLGLLAAGAWFVRQARTAATARAAAEIAAVEQALDAALARQDSALAALSQRFEQIDDLKTAQERRLRRSRNADHVRVAQSRGVGRVSGSDEIRRLAGAGRLVPLADTAYYHVQDLDYSVAYVTPETAALLRALGERFQAKLRAAGLPRYRYVISSVLRTAENQRALRRINPNATGGVSSHEFGTTLDVVYHTYVYRPAPEDRLPPTAYPFLDDRLERLRHRAYDALGMRYWQELQGLLGRTLIELQDEGAALVLLEREQPVFHITTAGPVKPEG
ncbi:MAG: DUF5715 family protein [Rhodothermales bacterium]|nr:DUF5715 family protein [Rhodothermales bacterium]